MVFSANLPVGTQARALSRFLCPHKQLLSSKTLKSLKNQIYSSLLIAGKL
jgi:hypothetical protein